MASMDQSVRDAVFSAAAGNNDLQLFVWRCMQDSTWGCVWVYSNAMV